MSYLAPVLPKMAVEAGHFLHAPLIDWNDIERPLLGTTLAPYQPLALRLDPKVVASLVEPDATPAAPPPAGTAAGTAAATATAAGASRTAAPAAAAESPAAAPATVSTAPPGGDAMIKIDDFQKLDIRVARIVDAQTVEGSDKLLRLTLDLGAEQRNVFSGIRAAYEPHTLVGRMVLMIANLEPRRMRFGISEGMVLCASGDGPNVYLLSPDLGATAGMKVT